MIPPGKQQTWATYLEDDDPNDERRVVGKIAPWLIIKSLSMSEQVVMTKISGSRLSLHLFLNSYAETYN